MKPLPKRTLLDGGRYLVVCSASNRGDAGEKDRLDALLKDARSEGLPTEHIHVIGSERLTTWCNQHPAVAAALGGRPDGLWRLTEWERSDEHEVEWLPTQVQVDAITQLRQELNLISGATLHLHIYGHPGVGKSRFALELCREASWAPFLIYVRQAADLRLTELIDSCVADQGVQLIVVADEVVLEQLLPLRASIGRANGCIRLITIGTSVSPEPSRIQPFEVRPMPEHEVTKVVQRWHSGMPIEQAQFVADFSAGYMRLAKLAAAAVHRNPNMDVRTMLEQHGVKTFLDAMLGTKDRGSLHVVAVLSSIGWTEEDEREGKAAFARVFVNSELIGVYVNVEQVDKRFLRAWAKDDEGWLFKLSGSADDGYKTNETTPNPYDQRLCFWDKNPCAVPAAAELETYLPQHLDVEQMLLLGGVNALIANSDAPYAKGNNFYFYDDPAGAPRLYMPWDLDTTMKDTSSLFAPSPSTLYTGVLFTHWQDDYDALFTNLLAISLAEEAILGELDRAVSVAGAVLDADPTFIGDPAADVAATMKTWWRARHAQITAELEASVP